MIRIDDNYVIEVENNCYTVIIDKHKIGKTGVPLYEVVGYFKDLEGAIKGILRSKVNKSFQGNEYTLESALKLIAETHKEFELMLEKAMKHG